MCINSCANFCQFYFHSPQGTIKEGVSNIQPWYPVSEDCFELDTLLTTWLPANSLWKAAEAKGSFPWFQLGLALAFATTRGMNQQMKAPLSPFFFFLSLSISLIFSLSLCLSNKQIHDFF